MGATRYYSVFAGRVFLGKRRIGQIHHDGSVEMLAK
jgi:hypothetical protein